MASADLCWQVMRVQSCHIVKKNQVSKWFSTDPLNPKNIHVKKFSGLSHRKALTIKASPKGKGVVLVAKTKNFRLNRPAKALREVPLTKHMRKINKAINGFAKSYGRSDLSVTLKRRATALIRAQSKARKVSPANKKD